MVGITHRPGGNCQCWVCKETYDRPQSPPPLYPPFSGSYDRTQKKDMELLMVGVSLLLTHVGLQAKDNDFKKAALAVAGKIQERSKELQKL